MANRIRELREARKLTQDDLAKILGVTREAISLWERDRAKPWARHRRALARKLDVAEADLGVED